ncbi:MAG: DUF1697 domain-containing protein [Anaerolineae bacterium]
MPRYVAFLRAINLGRERNVRMETLRRAFEALGFRAVSSYIASGNIIFDSPGRDPAALENRIEEALLNALGFEVTPFVRSSAELVRIAAYKPFPRSVMGPHDELGVLLLTTAPGPAAQRSLKSLQAPSDELRVRGREIYWLRHRSPAGEIYTATPFDRALNQPFTVRSLNTVRKIAEKYGGKVVP